MAMLTRWWTALATAMHCGPGPSMDVTILDLDLVSLSAAYWYSTPSATIWAPGGLTSAAHTLETPWRSCRRSQSHLRRRTGETSAVFVSPCQRTSRRRAIRTWSNPGDFRQVRRVTACMPGAYRSSQAAETLIISPDGDSRGRLGVRVSFWLPGQENPCEDVPSQRFPRTDPYDLDNAVSCLFGFWRLSPEITFHPHWMTVSAIFQSL